MNYTERNKMLDRVSVIALMCIFVELFLYAVSFKFGDGLNIMTDLKQLPIIMNVLGVIFLIISIVLFVLAFKKSKKKYLMFAIEFLVLAAACPFMTYYHFYSPASLRQFVTLKGLAVLVIIYYACRILYVCLHDYKVINFKKIFKKFSKNKKSKSN